MALGVLHAHDANGPYGYDPNLATDAWVGGVNVVPGDPRVVHHVIVYLDRSGVADQDDLRRAQRERRFRGALHELVGSVITPHGVDDDAVHVDHLATQRSRRARSGLPSARRSETCDAGQA